MIDNNLCKQESTITCITFHINDTCIYVCMYVHPIPSKTRSFVFAVYYRHLGLSAKDGYETKLLKFICYFIHIYNLTLFVSDDSNFKGARVLNM